MTKRSVRGEFNSFVKGFVTEASPLNFPEQAAKDISNFVLNKDGSVERRLGLDLNRNEFVEALSGTADNIVTYVWNEPGNVPNASFLVVSTEGALRIFDIKQDPWVELETLLITSPVKGSRSSFTSIDGMLVIARGRDFAEVVEYDPTSGVFSYFTYRLQSRDIWGIYVEESSLNPSWRPSTDNHLHRYNLYNAGWATQRAITTTPTYEDPTLDVFNGFGFYPAEIDSVWSGIVTQNSSGGIPFEVFREQVFKQSYNISAAPLKGHFIIDLLDRSESRKEAITFSASQNIEQVPITLSLIPDDLTEQGASVICEHAGRAFYAGFGPTVVGDYRSPSLSSYVAFSQLVNNRSDLSKCYQDGDPTSREASDIVDTDGGLIRISGAAGINSLLSLEKHLVVFAANGVWAIEGGSDYGFTATNYRVNKLSSFGCVSGNSVTSDGSRAYYWGSSGIFTVGKDEFGNLVVTNIIEARIAKYFNEIPTRAKEDCQGVYDLVNKQVRWLFPETYWIDYSTGSSELVLDTVLGAFYKNTIPVYLNTKAYSIYASESLGKTEYVAVQLASLSNPLQYTFCSYKDADHRDWATLDSIGVDAKAYLETGELTAGDSSVHKQTPILIVHMKRTEDALGLDYELENKSSCFIRTAWDFANSAATKKFGTLFQAYRLKRAYIPGSPGEFDNGFELMTSRNKLRGRGRALSIYMETEPYRKCHLIGWNLSMNGNAVA